MDPNSNLQFHGSLGSKASNSDSEDDDNGVNNWNDVERMCDDSKKGQVCDEEQADTEHVRDAREVLDELECIEQEADNVPARGNSVALDEHIRSNETADMHSVGETQDVSGGGKAENVSGDGEAEYVCGDGQAENISCDGKAGNVSGKRRAEDVRDDEQAETEHVRDARKVGDEHECIQQEVGYEPARGDSVAADEHFRCDEPEDIRRDEEAEDVSGDGKVGDVRGDEEPRHLCGDGQAGKVRGGEGAENAPSFEEPGDVPFDEESVVVRGDGEPEDGGCDREAENMRGSEVSEEMPKRDDEAKDVYGRDDAEAGEGQDGKFGRVTIRRELAGVFGFGEGEEVEELAHSERKITTYYPSLTAHDDDGAPIWQCGSILAGQCSGDLRIPGGLRIMNDVVTVSKGFLYSLSKENNATTGKRFVTMLCDYLSHDNMRPLLSLHTQAYLRGFIQQLYYRLRNQHVDLYTQRLNSKYCQFPCVWKKVDGTPASGETGTGSGKARVGLVCGDLAGQDWPVRIKQEPTDESPCGKDLEAGHDTPQPSASGPSSTNATTSGASLPDDCADPVRQGQNKKFAASVRRSQRKKKPFEKWSSPNWKQQQLLKRQLKKEKMQKISHRASLMRKQSLVEIYRKEQLGYLRLPGIPKRGLLPWNTASSRSRIAPLLPRFYSNRPGILMRVIKPRPSQSQVPASSQADQAQASGSSCQADQFQAPGSGHQTDQTQPPGVSHQADQLQSPSHSCQADQTQAPDISRQADQLQSPGTSCRADQLKVLGTSCQADQLQAPATSCQADQLQTPGISCQADQLQAPGTSCRGDQLQTPGISCQADQSQAPGTSCRGDQLQTPGISCQADQLQTPGTSCRGDQVQTPGSSLQSGKILASLLQAPRRSCRTYQAQTLGTSCQEVRRGEDRYAGADEDTDASVTTHTRLRPSIKTEPPDEVTLEEPAIADQSLYLSVKTEVTVKTTETVSPHVCFICGVRPADLTLHMKCRHPEAIRSGDYLAPDEERNFIDPFHGLTCDVCDCTFRRESDLIVHSWTHLADSKAEKERRMAEEKAIEEKERKEKERLEMLVQRENLVAMRRYGIPLPFRCDICLRRYKTESTLTMHRRIHEEERKGCETIKFNQASSYAKSQKREERMASHEYHKPRPYNFRNSGGAKPIRPS